MLILKTEAWHFVPNVSEFQTMNYSNDIKSNIPITI